MSEAHHGHGAHAEPSFFRKYIFSFDHKVIGIQYLVMAIVMALVGSTLAAIIRTQLAWPEKVIIQPETYISFVTMHGTIMIFFVVSIALNSGFGNFLIPLHVGARDMAYPLLNMLSFWVMVPACVLIIASFWLEGGAAAAGWTSYPPLSALPEAVPGSGMGQTYWLLAMALFIASFTMGGLNYVTTILNCRTKGLTMMRMPLVVWTFFIASILGILAFPALTAAAIMLLLDRHGGTSFFLPAGLVIGEKVMPHNGGTPLLFQHLFWFLGHPEVYVLALPALGVAFEVISTFARRPPFGYRISVYSLLVIAVLSMIVWGHHMFLSGMNPWVGEYFSIVTVLISVPFAVLALNLIASLWRARLRFTTPMLFALAMIPTVGLGGLGGLFLGTATADVFFHETYFVVGHFHLMIGMLTFLAIFAGMYYWFPKMFGRFMSEKLGRLHFWTTVPPILGIFILMHFQGFNGLLRRSYDPNVYTYNAAARALAAPITWLAFLLIGSQLLFLWNFVASLFRGRRAAENPWEATTLEWTTPSPAPHGNWEHPPEVHRDPYVLGTGAGREGRDFALQSETV